ncbi:putative amidoligase enzyme-domain-containing protein [Xylogone sp. PMI_703]|nr:putative amidoligase enzyme-domain-containing protein [Xylogone sp. PMI_703]
MDNYQDELYDADTSDPETQYEDAQSGEDSQNEDAQEEMYDADCSELETQYEDALPTQASEGTDSQERSHSREHPLTFGVEIEFILAYLPVDMPMPDPNDTRIVHFPFPSDDDDPHLSRLKTPESRTRYVMSKHIGETLISAGFPVQPGAVSEKDYGIWALATDYSIMCPHPDDPDYNDRYAPWHYMSWELRSPAYYFTPQAIQAVERVFALLTSTYLLSTNNTTGMHIHVGNEKKGFSTNTIRNLQAFFFAFEPQLLSAYPPDRVDILFARTPRRCARVIKEFCAVSEQMAAASGGNKSNSSSPSPTPSSKEEEDPNGAGSTDKEEGSSVSGSVSGSSDHTTWSSDHGNNPNRISSESPLYIAKYGPHPWQVVQVILEQTDWHELSSLLTGWDNADMVFSFAQLQIPGTPGHWRWGADMEPDKAKQTIEFRGYDASFDVEEVRNRIKTAVGIVDAMERITPESLRELVGVCRYEVWQRGGPGRYLYHTQGEYEFDYDEKDDADKVAEYGVPLAEGAFTLVDLLRYLELYGPARFYAKRGVYRHYKPAALWFPGNDPKEKNVSRAP